MSERKEKKVIPEEQHFIYLFPFFFFFFHFSFWLSKSRRLSQSGGELAPNHRQSHLPHTITHSHFLSLLVILQPYQTSAHCERSLSNTLHYFCPRVVDDVAFSNWQEVLMPFFFYFSICILCWRLTKATAVRIQRYAFKRNNIVCCVLLLPGLVYLFICKHRLAGYIFIIYIYIDVYLYYVFFVGL